jgi:anti-sigma factor RsiW
VKQTEINADLLSAYIDGELEPAEASQVAHLIASDEAVARRAAKLSEMKATVASMVPEIVVVTVPQRHSTRWRLPWAMAACLAFAIVAAAWLGLQPEPKNSPALEIAAAAAMQHDLWQDDRNESPLAPASTPAGLFAPEMVAAGLRLAFVRNEVVIDGHSALQAGYIGRHGCRLSLFRIPGLGFALDFGMSSEGDLLQASWAGDGVQFFLVARSMDEARFAFLAGVLKSVSEGGGRQEQEMIAGLEMMRQPCIG